MHGTHLRICFVSIEYPPFIVGGAGVYAKHICHELAKLGHDVHVVSPGTGCHLENSIENGVFVHRIPTQVTLFLKTASYWLKLRKYYKMLDEESHGFDLLHGNATSDFSLTRGLVKVPRVVTIHHLACTSFEAISPSFFEILLHPEDEVGLISWIEKKTLDFDRIVINRAEKIITASNFTKRTVMSTHGVPSSRIRVIHHGVYPEKYEYSEDEVTAMKNRLELTEQPLILFVGKLEMRKGLPLLLKAFKLISKRKKSKLVIVGSGKQQTLKRLASSLGIAKQVVFTGFVDDVTLRKLYVACDVFVLPSFFEGFGITLLEAMAAGKPIVATRAGGPSELIKDGAQGKLVDLGKSDELADALAWFLENPKQAQDIGKRNRKYVMENFSWKKNAEITKKLYESLVQT